MLYSRLQVIWADITVVGLFRGSNPVKACHMRKKKKKGKIWMFSQEQGRPSRNVLAVWHAMGWLYRLDLGIVSGFRLIIWKIITNGLPQKMQCSMPV